jgi:hypothetical protein
MYGMYGISDGMMLTALLGELPKAGWMDVRPEMTERGGNEDGHG